MSRPHRMALESRVSSHFRCSRFSSHGGHDAFIPLSRIIKRHISCSSGPSFNEARSTHGEFNHSFIMELCSRCRNGPEMASVLASIPSSQLAACSPLEASTLLSTMTRLKAVSPGAMDHVFKSLILTALEAEGDALTASFTSTARTIHSLSFLRVQEIRALLASSSVQRALLGAIDDLPRKRDGQSSQHLVDLGLLLQAFARCNLDMNRSEFSDIVSNAVRTRLGSANASSLLSLTATIASAFPSPSSTLHHLVPPLTRSALMTSASQLSSPSTASASPPLAVSYLAPENIGPALVSVMVVAVRSKRALPGLIRRLLALLSWHCSKSTELGLPSLNPRDISMALWALSRLQYRRVHQIFRSSGTVGSNRTYRTSSSSHLWGSLTKARRLVLGLGRRGKKLDPESYLIGPASSEWPEWTDAIVSVSKAILIAQEATAEATAENNSGWTSCSWDGHSITRSLTSLSKIGAAKKKDQIWLMLSSKALRAFHDSQTAAKRESTLGSKRFPLGEQQRRHAIKQCVAQAAMSLLPTAARFSSYDAWCLATLFRAFMGLVDLERLSIGRQAKWAPPNETENFLPPLTAQLHRRILAGGYRALKSTSMHQQPPMSMVLGTRQLIIVASTIMMLRRRITRDWADALAKAVESSLRNGSAIMTAAACISLLHCCQGRMDPDVASILVQSIHQDWVGRKYLLQRQVLSLIQAAADHGILHRPGIPPILIEIVRPRLRKLSTSGGSLPFVIEHLCFSGESSSAQVIVKGAKMKRILFLAVLESIRRASRIKQLLVLARGVTRHMNSGPTVDDDKERQLLGDLSKEIMAKAMSLREAMRGRGTLKGDQMMTLIDLERNRWML